MNKDIRKAMVHKVTINDILVRCDKRINVGINFFYIGEDAVVRDAEVVISPSELYDEIKECTAGAFTIDDDWLYIDTDIIIYIDKVLKNPMYPSVIKDMLSVYKQKVLNGEIF